MAMTLKIVFQLKREIEDLVRCAYLEKYVHGGV